MGRSLLVTLEKFIIYCKAVKVESNCVCTQDQEIMTVISRKFPDVHLFNFSTKGRFLVLEPKNRLYEKVDVKRVAIEIQENDEPLPSEHFSRMGLPFQWPPCMRYVEATFFRHLYRKCDFCTYFTSDIGALGYQCPDCRRANWPSPGLYIAQTRWPEQPMHSVWYRSAPTLYMVTDDLESYPLSHHKELCYTSDFLSTRHTVEQHKTTRDCLSKDEVMKKLGKWEDLI